MMPNMLKIFESAATKSCDQWNFIFLEYTQNKQIPIIFFQKHESFNTFRKNATATIRRLTVIPAEEIYKELYKIDSFLLVQKDDKLMTQQ